jgi:hypothetical protein
VPEENPQASSVVVGRNLKTPIHVGVTAWFMAQEPTDHVYARIVYGAEATLGNAGPRQRKHRGCDDPEWLACSVVLHAGDVVERLAVDSIGARHVPAILADALMDGPDAMRGVNQRRPSRR